MSFAPNHDSEEVNIDKDDDLAENRNILILYATETGTAQDVADRVAKECRRIHFKCRVSSMHSYPLSELISEPLVVFVVSTTGSGTEPRSMTPLWQQLLRSDLPSDLFDDLLYASFGLGDTSYDKFCWPSKLLARRLESLGGSEICKRGEGDEQDRLGIDGALEPWIEKLLETLQQLYPLPPGMIALAAEDKPPPRVSVQSVSDAAFKDYKDPLGVDKGYHTAFVKVNQRITALDWYQDVRHFEFEFKDDIQYLPGDVAVIHPEARSMDVESFLDSMGWSNIADVTFQIEHIMLDQSMPDHFPEQSTLRQIFTRYVNFDAVPRRSFFQILRHFTSDDLEREKLDEFLSPEGAVRILSYEFEFERLKGEQDDLYEYCYRTRRTIREVLSEFRSAKIPMEYVFDLFPPMRPREFSISSSIKRHPHQIHLCVAIVKYRTKLKMPRRGVCTTFLAGLKIGSSLRVGLRKGLVTLPKDPSVPIICVGPGTGIAPMKAAIEERIHQGSARNILYFGCRHASKDQHYASEFESFVKEQNLKYRVAWSRDGPEGVKRTYVQDLIADDGESIWEAIGHNSAWVYISGSSNKMPSAVKQAIRDAVVKYGGKTEDEATSFMAGMERSGRLIEECWS